MIKKRVTRHSRARRFLTYSATVLTKWRISHKPFNVSTDFVQNTVEVCAIPQNFVHKGYGPHFKNIFRYEGYEDILQLLERNTGKTPLEVRRILYGAGDSLWQ
jgi:hypothetical protein